MNRKVAILLPHKERFSNKGAGAVSTVVYEQVRASQIQDSLCVSGRRVGQLLDPGCFVPVDFAPIWYGNRGRRYIYGFRNAWANNWPGLIEIHNRPVYVNLVRKLFPGVALSLYLHNDPQEMRGARSSEERERLLGLVDRVICVSGYIKGRFLDGVRGEGRKVQVVLNGVDTCMINSVSLQDRRNDIVFIGRTVPGKGLHLLVEAWERLAGSYPGWRVVVIGGRYFSNNMRQQGYEAGLMARLERMGGQALVTGYLDRAAALGFLQKAKIAVLPSLWEDPCPLAPLEAIAAGCAVVTTRRGGIPEALGRAGIYLDQETPEGVVEALVALMSDEAYLEERHIVSREWATTQRDIRRVAGEIDSIRSELVGRVNI